MSKEFVEIGIPDNIKIHKNFQHLQIVRRWFGYKFIFLTLFVIAWDAFLINWYVMAFRSPGIDLIFILFPILHVSFGIGLTYYVLTGYFNRTIIDVTASTLVIRHGPLPFWGNKRVSSKMIRQLYCKRDGLPYARTAYQMFAVHVITSDHRNIKLLSWLDNTEEALFIEQEIEKFLNIEDQPVKGEIR